MSAAPEVLALELAVAVEIGMDATEGFTVSVLDNTLVWDLPTDRTIAGVLVYRAKLPTISRADDPTPVRLSPKATEYDLRSDPVTRTANGETFSFGVATIDDAGRESTLEVLEDVVLDFTAPAPVTNLRLVARD